MMLAIVLFLPAGLDHLVVLSGLALRKRVTRRSLVQGSSS
jgi:hypothetical protein